MSVEAITAQIEADALKPESASIDGNSVTKRSLKELRETADWLAGSEAVSAERPCLGIRFQKFTPFYR